MVQLQVGDHIFVVRPVGYSHHGIYVGELNGVKYVIHYTATGNKGLVSSVIKSSGKPACEECGYSANVNFGVVKTCLDCFLSGDSLRVKYYEDGNCKSSDEVVKTAYSLLQHGFGKYDLIINNCEHFATFCKTGKTKSVQVQVATDVALILPTAPVFGFALMIPKIGKLFNFGPKSLFER